MLKDLDGSYLTVKIPAECHRFVDQAVCRFSYLYPQVAVEVDRDMVRLSHQQMDLSNAARDLQFELYRQKIYAETLRLRTALIAGVMKR